MGQMMGQMVQGTTSFLEVRIQRRWVANLEGEVWLSWRAMGG